MAVTRFLKEGARRGVLSSVGKQGSVLKDPEYKKQQACTTRLQDVHMLILKVTVVSTARLKGSAAILRTKR